MCLYVVCVCVNIFACVLPHLYSGVCVMQVCNVFVHLEDQMGTQCIQFSAVVVSNFCVESVAQSGVHCKAAGLCRPVAVLA